MCSNRTLHLHPHPGTRSPSVHVKLYIRPPPATITRDFAAAGCNTAAPASHDGNPDIDSCAPTLLFTTRSRHFKAASQTKQSQVAANLPLPMPPLVAPGPIELGFSPSLSLPCLVAVETEVHELG